MDKKRIIILGAGYAGVNAAKLLNKKYEKNENIEITLIDKNPYHTLMTELHEVAGSRIEPDGIKIPFRKIFNRTKVEAITDNIISADPKSRKLQSESTCYSYDYLVVGAGSEPAYFGIPGIKENAFAIMTPPR
ncbi:MAG TPA: hypothetical protein DD426_09340 [Clostridiaceae bacterium]|nr:hypothetical protein [Clostridiaceae bacterium]